METVNVVGEVNLIYRVAQATIKSVIGYIGPTVEFGDSCSVQYPTLDFKRSLKM